VCTTDSIYGKGTELASAATQLEGLGARLAQEPANGRANVATAFRTACDWFMDGRRVDISALADEVGVSRVTMHRWVGTRDELLTEVMWHLTDRTIDRLQARVDAEALAPRTPQLLGRYVAAIADNTGVLRLQREEPEVFVRLCTTGVSAFQQRMIARVADLLATDREAGYITVDLEIEELAFATVRLLEAYAHAPSLTGTAADPVLTTRVLGALLR
jgi:AcrR family transcriptional regulator